MEPDTRPLACVTGASSGIGAAFAERLARDHCDVVMVARRRDRLDTLAQSLRDRYGITAEVFAADLSRPDEIRAVEARIAVASALDFLINNAGFGAYMPFTSLAPDLAEELINVKVLAVTRLTRAALPGMIARGRGAIVNVSSRFAFTGGMGATPLPKRATYAATKAYLNTFTRLLASELEGTGVQVQALCPSVVRTEFHQRMGMDPTQFRSVTIMQPDQVVEASLAGLRLGEVICMPTLGDPALLQEWEASERSVVEGSGGGIAPRYET